MSSATLRMSSAAAPPSNAATASSEPRPWGTRRSRTLRVRPVSAIMTIPNADRAIIAVEKLTAYLLNSSHKRGAAKARLLLGLGYRADAPEVLESHLREQHLSRVPTRTSQNGTA